MSTPLFPTPQMPMPGGETQLRLIKALESHESLYELCQELPRLADELRANPSCQRAGINVTKTADDIDADQRNGWPMVKLLHSMDKGVIQSILRGTVAFDTNVNWFPDPSPSHRSSGVYVIGLRRRGPSRKFLKCSEIRDLISGITRYMSGAAVLQSLGPDVPRRAMNRTQRGNVDWVRQVDEILDDPQRGAAASSSPSVRFMKDGDELTVQALIESLGSRILGPPHNDAFQIQTPMYVGCSTNLGERLVVYEPNRWLRNVNRPLALTMSVLAANGVDVEIVSRIVLRTWEDGQLPLAERLVTTLAGSLVCQTGFNATQAGSNNGKSALVPDSVSERVQRANIDVNSLRTLEEVQRRRDWIHNFFQVYGLVECAAIRVRDDMANLDEHKRRQLITPRDQKIEKLKEVLAKLEERRLELLEALKVTRAINRIAELRLGMEVEELD